MQWWKTSRQLLRIPDQRVKRLRQEQLWSAGLSFQGSVRLIRTWCKLMPGMWREHAQHPYPKKLCPAMGCILHPAQQLAAASLPPISCETKEKRVQLMSLWATEHTPHVTAHFIICASLIQRHRSLDCAGCCAGTVEPRAKGSCGSDWCSWLAAPFLSQIFNLF